MAMIKGGIYKLKEDFRDVYESHCYNHPFIFWTNEYSEFRGIMLTHSDKFQFQNKAMNHLHFKSRKVFTCQGRKSFIAPYLLLKDIKENQVEKIDELTDEGIDFIRSNIKSLPYAIWDDVYKQNRDANSQKKCQV